MNILRNRIRVRKDSTAHSVSPVWKKLFSLLFSFLRFYTGRVMNRGADHWLP
jgi:hypothetical protein